MLSHSKKQKIPILMYHSISRNTTPKFKQFVVSPGLFVDHMAYLHQHAYTPITITQLVKFLGQGGYALPERPVILTFDDGFADFFTEALPVLERYGFTATLYIPTAYINDTSRWLQREGEASRLMLTWDQLTEISEWGIECGAHSHSHSQLDTLPRSAAQDEIVQCKRLLEDHLGHEVLSFAYPFGHHTATVRQLVREVGYTSACAVKYAMSTETIDPFALARLMVRANTSVDALARLLNGRSSSILATAYTRTRTPAWQLVRRCSASTMRYLQKGVPA